MEWMDGGRFAAPIPRRYMLDVDQPDDTSSVYSFVWQNSPEWLIQELLASQSVYPEVARDIFYKTIVAFYDDVEREEFEKFISLNRDFFVEERTFYFT